MFLRSKLVFGVLVVSLASLAAAQKPTVKKGPARYTSPTSGAEMYTAYCASCHGKAGQGDGPAAAALKTPPPDLTVLSKRNEGKFPADHVYAVIKGEAQMAAHGSSEMPVWGPVFLALNGVHPSTVHLRINNLTKYIQSMQVK